MIDLAIGIFKYFSTSWFNISVPPVVKLLRKTRPYPKPLIAPPRIAIINGSKSSIIKSFSPDVRETNKGNTNEPSKVFLVFSLPSNLKLIKTKNILIR